MMRIIIHFFLILSGLIATGCSNQLADLGQQAVATMTQTPRTDVAATLMALPAGPNVATSRMVLDAFFGAYNRHDVEGVLRTLSETFAYGDCDFEAREMSVFETREDLAAWLQTKFAQEDQFLVEKMIIAPAEGSPPNEPRLTAVRVERTNPCFEKLRRQSLFKIVLNEDGNRIQYLNAYGNVDCEAGR